MNFTKPFNSLSQEDTDIAGGKGASLGEMINVGIPVPTGFVILSDAFEQFLRETKLLEEIDTTLHSVNHNQIHTVEAASEKIKSLVLSRDVPVDIATEVKRSFKVLDSEYVAVRSSATAEDGVDHAWAGQLESFLNTAESDLLDKVKYCWASLFAPRAIFYQFEKGLHTTKISVAVVVQKMVESEVSGVAFSVHPVTADRNQLIIEAGFGLGEAIVSGLVTPDSYVVEKEPRNIIDINISTQNKGLYRSENASAEHGNNKWKNIPEPKASSQVLTKEQILELSEIILKIENHYGSPCDIEWAYEAGKFYVLQSRPITMFENKYITSKNWRDINWSLYLSRPFNLFVSSVWNRWYVSDLMREKIRVSTPNGLFIEYPKGTAKHYREKDLIDDMKERMASISLTDTSKSTKLLERGKELNKFVANLLRNKKSLNLHECVDMLIELAIHSTIFPMFAAEKLNTSNKDHHIIIKYCEELRSESYYPVFISDIFIPLVKEILVSNGIPEDNYAFLTIDELLQNDFSNINTRKESEENGYSFVYGYINGKGFVNYVNNPKEIILKIEKDINSRIQGNIAYPGKVVGTAHIVSSNSVEGVKFNKGEILIAMSTNPGLAPLMKKAGAIVTDEGGLMCHAAILSREFSVPCIVGTRNATRVLRNGDLIEVDANSGLVTIISSKS